MSAQYKVAEKAKDVVKKHHEFYGYQELLRDKSRFYRVPLKLFYEINKSN